MANVIRQTFAIKEGLDTVPDLSTTFAGVRLKNPVLVASAGITGTVDRLRRAEDAGAGAVTMKSLFENPIPRNGDPTPHMLIVRRRLGPITSDTLYSYEQCSRFDEEQYAEEIFQAKRSLSIPVFANIDCRTSEAWLRYCRLVEEAGADGIEVKSCPHGEHLMDGSELREVVRLVKAAVRVPVVPKLPSQLTNPYRSALDLEEAGADGLVMFNRLSGLDIDIETGSPVMHGGVAGHGGPWSLHYVLRWVTQTAPSLSIRVCASGGVGGGEDVVKYLLGGAAAVQMATLVIVEGYAAIGRVLVDLAGWMDRGGYATIEAFRGRAAGRLVGLGAVCRERRLVATVDSAGCNGCRRCQEVCIYQAIASEGTVCRVGPGCSGCGLCVQLCPETAIRMVPAG